MQGIPAYLKLNDVDSFDRVTHKIIAAAMAVHRAIGPGLLESAYQACLAMEFSESGLRFVEQVDLPITYRGRTLDCGYRLDFVVEDAVIVEIKSVEALAPIHQAQLLSYLRMSNRRVGLLINFNVPILKNGLKRVVNQFPSATSASRR